jgi:hypothetical protein
MIDTDDIAYLFIFCAEDLMDAGFRPETSRPELNALLLRASAPSARPMRAMQLDFSLKEFATALRKNGAGAQFMWPGSTVESAGLRLVLTHIDEELRSKPLPDDGPLRMSLRKATVKLHAAVDR